MHRPSISRIVPLLLLLAPPSVLPKEQRRPPEHAGIPVARIAFGDDRVERQSPGESWERVEEGARVKTGDRLRTGSHATARVEFPWMNVLVGPKTVLTIPASRVLSTLLEEGRVEQRALGGGEIIKIQTAEAVVRGAGWVVVRRTAAGTGVVVFGGRFRVQGKGRNLTLTQGKGTVIVPGQPPSPPVALPEPPKGLMPGADPVYVSRGEPVTLSWSDGGPLQHLQVLEIDSEEVLIDRDVGPAPVSITIPWPGTYRWRVSTRDEWGLDGVPSVEGYVCVMDKIGGTEHAGQSPRGFPRASSASRRTASSGSCVEPFRTGMGPRASGPIRPCSAPSSSGAPRPGS